MIPAFDENGNLPPGIHEASWEEIFESFGRGKKRRELLEGLRKALDDLASVGCQVVYIDGSFVTKKDRPNDFDACWEKTGVNQTEMQFRHPLFLDEGDMRKGRKKTESKIWWGVIPSLQNC
jgi:hypothetical protein